MLDRTKLNKVRGILSARQGAEIPKFKNGNRFLRQKGNDFIYSLDGNTWFSDEALQIPYTGSLEGFYDVSVPMAIPGDPGYTPNTAVELSSANQQQTNLGIGSNLLPELEVIAQKISPNEGVISNKELNFPTTIQVPEYIKEQTKSAGMKFKQEQEELELQKEKEKRTNSTIGQATQLGKEIFQGVGSAIGQQQTATDSNLTTGANVSYNAMTSVMGPKWGTALKNLAVAGDIIQSMGGGTDQMTSTDKWMDSSFFSWNVGMINGFGGKKADSFAIDQNIASEVGSSYGGTMDDLSKAASKSGKKYGLFSSSARRKANKQIADAKYKQNLMGDIADTAQDQRMYVQSMGEQAGLAYSLMTDGGYDQKYTYAAKHGGIIEWNPVLELEWEPKVELNWELQTFKEGGNIELVEELEWIPEFKEGGKTINNNTPEIEETTQKNVIPEGALHKNKHHMEHAEGLTKKGIPVIDEDGEQQAEIEHSEIIFTLEVTKKLEEYYEIFYSEETSNKEKEQAALDAGKLLVYQILENTEDRTGLIESCKKGGSLTFKKSTDDLIEEVLDWVPTLMIVEEVVEEVKEEENPKKKSEKEQMKEAIKEVLIELLTK